MRQFFALALALPLFGGCASHRLLSDVDQAPAEVTVASSEDAATSAATRRAAKSAIEALQAGRFDEATRAAEQVLLRNSKSSYAQLVWAVGQYRKTAQQLWIDLRTVAVGALETRRLNQRYLRSALDLADRDLVKVAGALAIAASDPAIAIELCLACWEIDWNGNGRIDRRDKLLLQIEQDRAGEPIARNDPRRKPTFRFDHGDIAWARAFVSFQRAALSLALAYELDDANAALAKRRRKLPKEIVIRLARPDRVRKARLLILAGLAHSNNARRAYLAETDDDREWVPNPQQRSHPMPLPINQALYQTWEWVLGDATRLLNSEEGLSVAQFARLTGLELEPPPTGYLDIGRMLAKPRDIVLRPKQLRQMIRRRDVAGVLESVLGHHYRSTMKPSPLLGRLERMKGEVSRGEETFERKLRYLLWLN